MGTTTYDYDPNGNLIGVGDRQLAYDAAERLTAVVDGLEVRHYAYDGVGKRIQSTTRLLGLEPTDLTRFTWDPTLHVPEVVIERDANHDVARRYTYGLDRISMTADGSEHYFHHDRIGSTTHLTDATGAAEWAYSYEPFGTPRAATQLSATAPANQQLFAGEHLDPTAGLYHLRARHYDPDLGRFTQPDPLEAVIGRPFTASYAYADNDPINRTDPLGLRSKAHVTSPGHFLSPDMFHSGRHFFLDLVEVDLVNIDRNYGLPGIGAPLAVPLPGGLRDFAIGIDYASERTTSYAEVYKYSLAGNEIEIDYMLIELRVEDSALMVGLFDSSGSPLAETDGTLQEVSFTIIESEHLGDAPLIRTINHIQSTSFLECITRRDLDGTYSTSCY